VVPSHSRRTHPDSASAGEALCPDCGGSGWKVLDDGLLSICSCGCYEAQQRRIRLDEARIPDRYLNKSLDTFIARDRQRRDVLNAARAYAQGFHLREEIPALILQGPTGSGKTHVAIGILREAIARGYTGFYCNVNELLARLRATYQDESEEFESDVIEQLAGCDLLVLDDLGSEVTTGWVLDRLYLLINQRYEAVRPVIITTNCDKDTLREKVGPRIASRLYEMCKAPFPPFPNDDFRLKPLQS